ncbi:MAG: hypothetical protein LUO88_00470, partial [Methanoregulaceae archaeon]|nr:hypothetical protein [Methanoregulaceae archaeon]
ANAAADVFQLSVPFTIVVLSGSPDLSGAYLLPVCFVSAIVAANAIGTLIPVFSGSSAEVHLASFIAVLAVVAVSTPFMPVLYSIGQYLPFGALSAGLMSSWGGTPASWYILAAAPAGAIAIVLVVAGCAGHLKATD